jgi:hypothetical protein
MRALAFVVAFGLAFGLACLVSIASAQAEPVGLVIVYPGGPDAGGEGKKLADELGEHLAASVNLKASDFAGQYFNDAPAALTYLKVHKDAFILGGLGFFLAERKTLKLVPLARLRTNAGGTETVFEEFFVVVRKGSFANLDALKGKTLWGSVLYDDARYVDRLAFGGKMQACVSFVCKPTPRPLSAIRKLDSGEADAVLLNRAQLAALKPMPLFEKLQIIYSSGSLPTVGLMMIDTPRTRPLRDKIVEAVSKLCASARGTTVCQTFGITGFDPVTEEDLGAAIKKYDAR